MHSPRLHSNKSIDFRSILEIQKWSKWIMFAFLVISCILVSYIRWARHLPRTWIFHSSTPYVYISETTVDYDDGFTVPLGSKQDMAAGIWPPPDFRIDNSDDDEYRLQTNARHRQQVVRQAMQHAWSAYEKYALGADEILPATGYPRNNWGRVGATLIDSLDTLWLMDLKDEFYRARDYCRDYLDFGKAPGKVSVFEVTIRVLGGLLSAYELSRDEVFLEQAADIGKRLSRAFEMHKSGLPESHIYLREESAIWKRIERRFSQSRYYTSIASIGTLQLEFHTLAYLTKQPKYAEIVDRVYSVLNKIPTINGLRQNFVDLENGKSIGGSISFGSSGDSYYEYLLKVWIHEGNTPGEEYERAVDGLHEKLLSRNKDGLLFVADYDVAGFGGRILKQMDHLACFVPGMLALGAKKRGTGTPEQQQKNQRDMQTAKALVYACVQMYEYQPTGISAEHVRWSTETSQLLPEHGITLLRPETAESLFILYSITKHPVYRDWGHRIMVNIEKYAKLPYGYGALDDVGSKSPNALNRMESFVLAETFKYLYLLQDDQAASKVNLDEWVFNTEAHPLRVLPRDWRQRLGEL